MNFTPDQIRAMKGVDLPSGELDAILERPSRLVPLLGELVTEDCGRKGKRPRNVKVNDLGQNQGEARLDVHLAELKRTWRIKDYAFEPFNLKLPGRVFFRIDFVVKRLDDSLVLIDYKGGPIEDDSLVKLKICSESYSWLGPTYVARYVHKEHLFFPVFGGRVDVVPDLNWMGVEG